MKLSRPQLILDAQALLGEGPTWDAAHQRLYWLNIIPGELHIYDPASGQDQVVTVGQKIGCVGLTRDDSVLLGLKQGLARLNPATAQLDWIAHPESHIPHNRFNDGKCGPDGRFIVGSMDDNEVENSGFLYSLSPDGTLKTLLSGIYISNGLTWSPDCKTLYYIDTPTRKVRAFDYDLSSGEIANERVVVTIPDGMGWPDGMTSDKQGRLWIGMWGGAALTVWNPDNGELIRRVPVPAVNVSACVFGGPNLNELYVTSARVGISKTQASRRPKTGGLFRIVTDAEGMETFRFGG